MKTNSSEMQGIQELISLSNREAESTPISDIFH